MTAHGLHPTAWSRALRRLQRRVARRPLRATGLPLAALALLLPSCALLSQLGQGTFPVGGEAVQGVQPLLPRVSYLGAALVQAPSQLQLAAYYCPEVVPDPFGLPGVARLACAQAFGPAPRPDDLRVAFDLRFSVDNPNHFPIPVAELLTAATVFPSAEATALGAACVTLCGASQPDCSGRPAPGACQASSRDLRSLGDFQRAVAQLLVSAGLSALAGQRPSFSLPPVVSDGHVELTARFSFGPQPLLATLRQLASQAVEQLQRGQPPRLAIPYRLEGTVWFDVGSLGRVAVGFGPAQGSWTLPVEALLP